MSSTAACTPDGSKTYKISYTEDLTDPAQPAKSVRLTRGRPPVRLRPRLPGPSGATDNAPDYGSGEWGFESLGGRFAQGRLAQWKSAAFTPRVRRVRSPRRLRSSTMVGIAQRQS